jgi:hypothetical protein
MVFAHYRKEIKINIQDEREKIVLRAMNLRQDDINDLEAFDALVCHALGIDDDEPPMFIADSLLSTP